MCLIFFQINFLLTLHFVVVYGESAIILPKEQNDVFENPEETGPYFEGDIRSREVDLLNSINIGRNGELAETYRWPNGVVPYEIVGSFSSHELAILNHAISEYHAKTCIRFRKRSNEPDYVLLKNARSGCWSSVGRQGGPQVVNLETPKCFSNYGTTIHELMHALGFYHEQNRYERDSYVHVLGENVKPGMMINFQKLPFGRATAFGIEYDYASVMHYKATSFSKNGKATLVAVTSSPDINRMGQRKGFSPRDIRKLNSMYKCI